MRRPACAPRSRIAACAGFAAILLLALPLSAAIRISEVMYNPPQGPAYEYLEIHNQSDAPADAGGYSFVEGVSYTIPAGRVIPARGYLVICADPVKLLAAYPGLDPAKVIGGHASQLDSNGERITLLDQGGTVVETFRYNDDPPWDFLADGFGASLERLCLDAPADLPENWRASPLPDSTEAFAGSPGGASSQELCPPQEPLRPRVYLSEIMYHPVEENSLEDDHEFIELYNAEDQPVSLAGWRLAGGTDFAFPGTASIGAKGFLILSKNRSRLLQVTAYALDPALVLGNYSRSLDNGGEKAALIGALGQGVDSITYDDDFPWPEGADALGADEEWLPSSVLPLTQHRYRGISLERVSFDLPGGLVYNWAPSPLDGATPGRTNASARSEPLPIVVELAAGPATGPGPLIRKTDQALVRARFDPPDAVSGVVLEYFLDDVDDDGEPILSAPMNDDGQAGDPVAGDSEFSARLAARPDGTLVRYRIKADRGAGVEVLSPRPSDPHGWHAYFVSPAVTTQTRLYQVLISPASWTEMYNNITGGRVSGCTARDSWDGEVPAVFIHEGLVFDVFVRYQGSRYNRTNGPPINDWPYSGPTQPSPLKALSWHFSFPRYAQHEGRSKIILNKLVQGCPGLDAAVGYRLFAAAGVPAPTARYARLHVNGGYYHYMMEYERPGEEMMRRWHREREAADPSLPKERVGHLHKSVGCNCDEGPWGWGDERVLGAACGYTALQRYGATYDRKTHGWADASNVQNLIEEMDAIRGDTEALRSFFEERFDLELLLNHMAVMNWSVPFDDMFQNHFLYQRLSDEKWLLVPWDLDLNFGGWKGAQASFYVGELNDPDNRSGWWNYLKDSFLKSYRSEFEERLVLLTNTILRPSEVNKLVDQVMAEARPAEAAQAPAGVACSFSGDASVFKSFAAERFQLVNRLLSAVLVDAGPDQTVLAGSVVQFDARASRPDPGPAAVYSWSNGMSGETPTRQFNEPGEFPITLTITVNGTPYQDSLAITVLAPPEEAFGEEDGRIVFEAEHVYVNDRHASADVRWAEETSTAGFSGSGYMRAADNGTRTNFLTNYAATAPELRYAVLFRGTGNYRIWIRGQSSSSSADSCHVGLDGAARPEAFAQRFAVSPNYVWSGETREQGSQIVNIPTPGLRLLSIWVRESRQIIDKIVIAKEPSSAPQGQGPAESPLVPLSGGEPFVRGDANADKTIDIADPVAILFHLFAGGAAVRCEDHADADDSGKVELADALYVLAFLYRSGAPPLAPYPGAGFDATADAASCGDAP